MTTTGPAAPGSRDEPKSLLEQFGNTRGSFSRLIGAHVALFKAELSEILGLVKVIGTLAAVALVVGLTTANLLYIGGFLFLGEWLFGSMGWGLAHGVLFGFALITALMLGILGAPMSRTIVSFVIATILIIGVALLLGSNIPYNAAASVATSMPSPVNTPGWVALIVGAVIGAILFALLLARLAGRGGAIAGLVLGLIIGALVGWLMGGAPWTWPPAVGFAITLGLAAWIVLNVVLSVPSLDVAARFAKLKPTQTMEVIDETKTFLEEQWRRRQPKLGRK